MKPVLGSGRGLAESGQLGSLEFAGASVPYQGLSSSGDAWQAWSDEHSVVWAVVDGVGHGPSAELAATLALGHISALLAEQPTAPLDELIKSCHEALRRTVGAALTLLRVRGDELEMCGLGNVELESYPTSGSRGVPYPGTVGYRCRKLNVFRSRLLPGDLLRLSTDGVRSSFRLQSPSDTLARYANQSLAEHARSTDDATLVLTRYGA